MACESRQKLGLGSFLLLAFLQISASAEGQSFKVTTGNAVDLGFGGAEPTVAAIGPGQNRHCPQGRLFFASSNTVLATNLNGQAVTWVNPTESPNPRSFQYSETVAPRLIYDNHLVKLKDNSLVHTVEAITWNDNVEDPKPAWWNLTKEFPLKKEYLPGGQPGGRAIIYVHRSVDCGRTWTPAMDIDAAKLEVADPNGVPTEGLCGTPRLKRALQTVTVSVGGKPTKQTVPVQWSEGGGWDGHFLYADPYSGNLFLSTPCDYGTGKLNEERRLVLFLMSPDRGNSWKVIRRIDPQKEWIFGWRIPITSLPSGQVAFSYWGAGGLTVATVNPPYAPADFQAPQPLWAPSSGDFAPGTDMRAFMKTYPSIARDPGKGFLASTSDWMAMESGTKLIYRLFDVPSPGGGGQQLPKAIVAPDARDVMQGTFIDGTPTTDLHTFFWVERTPGPMAANGKLLPNQFRIKFQVYKGTKELLRKPGELTIANGSPYTYLPGPFDPANPVTAFFVGDYMGGASYSDRNGQHFVAAWSEQGRLRFNRITITPQILTVKEPTAVDVQIVPQKIPLQPRLQEVPKVEAAKPAVLEVREE